MVSIGRGGEGRGKGMYNFGVPAGPQTIVPPIVAPVTNAFFVDDANALLALWRCSSSSVSPALMACPKDATYPMTRKIVFRNLITTSDYRRVTVRRPLTSVAVIYSIDANKICINYLPGILSKNFVPLPSGPKKPPGI